MPPTIHRHVKFSNILLNEKLQAKLTGFGLSEGVPDDRSEYLSTEVDDCSEYLSTEVVGTVGYLYSE